MKTCLTCKIEKELPEFGNSKYRKDGLRGDCRECVSKTQREARANLGKKEIVKGSYLWHLKQSGMFDYYKNYIKN